MSHPAHVWGALEDDGPVKHVARRPQPRRHPYPSGSSTRGRLGRVPNTIGLALVVATGGLAVFDIYLLASSGLH